MPKFKDPTGKDDIIHKKPAARSVAYPAHTISYSRDFTQSVYSNFGGNTFNTRETIAKILKKNPDYLKSVISTAVQYGLLELRSKVGYRPTPRFMDLYKQDDPFIFKETQIACLKTPPLYANLLETFKGDIVPPLNVLANLLFKKHGIVENVSEKVATIFLQNLDDLGLLSIDRKLVDLDRASDIKTEIKEEPEEEKREEEILDEEPEKKDNIKKDNKKSEDLSFVIEVPLGEGRKAKILCPMDIVDKEYTKILRVVSSYMDNPIEITAAK